MVTEPQHEYREVVPAGRLPVAGLEFDPLSQSEVIDQLFSRFREGHGGRAVFVNIDVAVRAQRDPSLRPLVEQADLVLADGMPLVWASRLLHTPLPERVAGSTVLTGILKRAVDEDLPVMLVGGKPGSAEAAVESLRAGRGPIRAGWHTPPFGFERDPAAMEAIEASLDSFGRCLCFVGLGFPKQEKLMEALAKRRPDWWFIATGAGIDFLGGGRRAPRWMQRAGMEWMYRLAREPKRLARRYLIEDAPFAARLLVASAWQGRSR